MRSTSVGPGDGKGLAGLGELGVPHVERERRRLVEAVAAGRLLEQGVALAQDPVDLDSQCVVARMERDQRVVEIAPPLRRAALHEREVVRREHADPQRAEQIT